MIGATAGNTRPAAHSDTPFNSSTRPSRAAVWTGPGCSEIRVHERPRPQARQVLIRLEGCGVCSSNLPVWEGRPWFQYPLPPGAPGHEGWGVVAEIGDAVTNVKVGQRVAALSYAAYSDYDLAECDAVVPLPSDLNDVPFPGEPLACAYNVYRRSRVRAGDHVAVVGIGLLGAILVRLCSDAGAKVLAISRRAFAQALAREQGAEVAIGSDDPHAVQQFVRDWTAGEGCAVAIEATGAQEPLAMAGELVKTRGTLVIAGYHQDGSRTINMQSWNWRGIDVVNAHERDPNIYVEGMRMAIQAAASGKLETRRLFTHTFSLEQLPEALELTRRRPDGFLKALIVNDT